METKQLHIHQNLHSMVMPHIQLHRPYANQFETSNDKLVDDWVDCEVYIDLCT